MRCQKRSKEGFDRSSYLVPGSTLLLSEIPISHNRFSSMKWTTPLRNNGNVSSWLKLEFRFPPHLFSSQSISNRTSWERSSTPQAYGKTRPRFLPGSELSHI